MSLPNVCGPVIFSFMFFALAWAAPAQQLPDGSGKAALLKVCGPCHGAENVIGHAKTREEWAQLVGEMVSYGAQGSEDELNQIVDYLTKNFSKKTVEDVKRSPAPKEH